MGIFEKIFKLVELKFKLHYKNIAMFLYYLFSLTKRYKRESILHMSDIFISNKKNKKAIRLLEKELSISPQYGYLFQLAYIYGLEGEWQKEIKIYNDILDHHILTGEDIDINVLNNLIQTYCELHEYDKAIEIITGHVEKIDPQTVDNSLFLNSGNIYYYLKEFDKAIGHYFKSLSSNYNQSVYAYQNIANCYSEIGNHYKALEYYQIALNQSVTHISLGKALYGIGCVYYELNDTEKAHTYFIKAADKGNVLAKDILKKEFITK